MLEKAIISDSANIERSVVRSRTSGYLSGSQELDNRTKLSSSLLNSVKDNDSKVDSNIRERTSSSNSSIRQVDSSSDSSEVNDCYECCNCHFKSKQASTRKRNSVTSSRMSKSIQLTKECFIAELVGTFLLVVSIYLNSETDSLEKRLLSKIMN